MIYPTSLPKALPVSGVPESGVIRTQMDVGASKVRRRTTATVKPLTFTMRITGTQFSILRTFYHTTTLEGSAVFDMEDPWDDNTKEWRFTAPYEWRLIVGSSASASRWYEITLYLEKMP